MKLTSIEILGMHNIKHKMYDLSDMNYFFGKNGSGKSTVLQAIQLALLGYIPGTNKQSAAIFKHSNGPSMTVKLTIDDDGTPVSISRSWSLNKSTVVATSSIQPESYCTDDIIGNLELPVFNFSEFMNMSANQIKDWFIKFLPASNKDIDWQATLSETISSIPKVLDKNFVADVVAYATTLKGSAITQVRDLNDYLKSQMSFLKGSLSRLDSTIQSLVHYSDVDDDVSSDEVNSKIAELETEKSVLADQLIKLSHNKRIDDQLANLDYAICESIDRDPKVIELNSKCDKLSDDITKSKNAKDLVEHDMYRLKREVDNLSSTIKGNGLCPYTKSKCEAICEMIEANSKELEKVKSALSAKEQELAKYDAECSTLIDEYAAATTELNYIKLAYTKYENAISSKYPDIDHIDEELVNNRMIQINEELAELRDLIVKIAANDRYESLQEQITCEKFATEQNIEICKAWTKLTDMNGLQSEIMEAPFVELAESMTKYLRELWDNVEVSAKFNLSSKANSFSFGILDNDDNYIEFDLLSSGEKCIFTLSLLMSIVEKANTSLPLILIDDLLDHLDGKVDHVFDALYKLSGPIQIVVAGVKSCTHPKSDEFLKVVQ